MHAEPARPASPSGSLPSDSSETRMKHFTAVQDAPDVTPNHAAGDATRDDDHDRAHRDVHDDAHVARTSSDPLALPHPRSSLAPAAPAVAAAATGAEALRPSAGLRYARAVLSRSPPRTWTS